MSDAEDTAVGAIVSATRDALDVYGQTIRDESAAALAQAQADLAAVEQQNASLQTQVDQDAATITADAETVSTLQAQHTADQATIGQQAARIAQLEAELADPGLIVGARLRDVSYAIGNAQIGPIRATRNFFEPFEALPPVWVAPAGWPADTIWIVSYKDENDPNLPQFSQSLHAQGGLLAWHHEPEADFASGADFVTRWKTQQAVVKAAAPDLPFGMIAGASQYAKGNAGADGSFIPDGADFYSIDTYLVGANTGVNRLQPLETEPRFQTWYGYVKDRPGFKAITEYGRGLADTTQWDAQRAALFPVDQAYLQQEGFRFWLYWYTSGGGSKNWRFIDPNSQAAWRAVAAG